MFQKMISTSLLSIFLFCLAIPALSFQKDPVPPDIFPPAIIIDQPLSGQTTSENHINFQGSVFDEESGISEVIVSDQQVFNGQDMEQIINTVSFEVEVFLNPGENTVPVEAIDLVGNRSVEFVEIFWEDQTKPPIIIEIWIGKLYSFINKEYKKLEVAPCIVNNRTIVPLRFIAEGFLAVVNYDPLSQKIRISLDNTLITLQINYSFALLEIKKGEELIRNLISLDTPPIIQNGRTLVPLRFIADGFSAITEWNALEEKVTIVLNH